MREAFRDLYERDPEVVASAPGRVNLIGDHTDYNGGFVLPTVIPQRTSFSLARRHDDRVRGASLQIDGARVHCYGLGSETPVQGWIDYVQGVTWALAERGVRLGGFDFLADSSVPVGKGLSSSAALEIAALRALTQAFDLPLTAVDTALTGHLAETGFVRAPVGIMDQMVCSLGTDDTALFLDAGTRQFELIPLPDSAEFGVIDSGISHHHATGAYQQRRRECDEAAALLGVKQLSALYEDDLPRADRLPEPLNRRARHVICENARVLSAVDALRACDRETLGRLFLESHRSLSQDFETSLPQIDHLVALSSNTPHVTGARLTGGGFGGAIVIVAAPGTIANATRAIAARYRDDTGLHADIVLPNS